MNKKIDYTFNIDGFYDSVNYYRSLTPMNPLSMPAPTATGITGLAYSDTTAEANKEYFVRFGSVKNAIEKLSDEISVSTRTSNDELIDYVQLYMPLTEDLSVAVGDQIITQVGANNGFIASGGVGGGGYYQAGAGSYFEFNMPNFFGTEPFCIEYYAKTSGVSLDGVTSFGATLNQDYATITHTVASLFVSTNNANWTHSQITHGGTSNTFAHYAFTWDGAAFRRFKDGVLQGTSAISSFTQTKVKAVIGKKSNALTASKINGVQHLRLTKGHARYTANFVPPTEFIY